VPRNWAGLLEEHEILFPETKKARVVLLERAYAIFSGLADCLNELRAFSSSAQALLTRRERALERAMTLMRALNPDQLALMHDLRVYLQNRCLGHITGNAVPPRRPTDPSLPVLWENADGELEVQRALPQHPVCEEDLVQKIVALESQLRDIAGHRRYDAHAVTEDVHQEELRLIAERAALLALLKYEDVERLSLIPRV
jgi:hypothetical protein